MIWYVASSCKDKFLYRASLDFFSIYFGVCSVQCGDVLFGKSIFSIAHHTAMWILWIQLPRTYPLFFDTSAYVFWLFFCTFLVAFVGTLKGLIHRFCAHTIPFHKIWHFLILLAASQLQILTVLTVINHILTIITHILTIIDHKLTIINHILTIINHKLTIINHKLTIINHILTIINHILTIY